MASNSLVARIISVAIVYYRQRRRETEVEKHLMQEAFKRELLQSRIKIQNQTLQQIAQELHDHIGQLLTVAIMRLNALEVEL